jgi:hypothetical protein
VWVARAGVLHADVRAAIRDVANLLPGLVELTGFEARDFVCHSLSLQLRDATKRGIDGSSDPLAGTLVEPMASHQFFMGSKAAASC